MRGSSDDGSSLSCASDADTVSCLVRCLPDEDGADEDDAAAAASATVGGCMRRISSPLDDGDGGSTSLGSDGLCGCDWLAIVTARGELNGASTMRMMDGGSSGEAASVQQH